MARFQAMFISLPPELIEEIIIISATFLGDVRAPSTLAQTCRAFRALIYHQSHKYLWREMFLILFDDPRPAHEVRAHGRIPQRPPHDAHDKGKGISKDCLVNQKFPWEDEYKMRIWTESFVHRRTRPALSGSSSSRDARPDLPSTDTELCTILEILLCVILTAAPLPYHALVSMTSHFPPRGPPHPHPIFSPVLMFAHTHPALGHGSRNISWLARVLEHGLPSELMAPLTVFDENGQVDVQKRPVQWDGLLAKLVAQVGLMIPYHADTPDVDHSEVGPEGDSDTVTQVASESRHLSHNQEEAHSLSDDDSDFEPQPSSEQNDDQGESDGESEIEVTSTEMFRATVKLATTSQTGVRRLARLRVYNMAYLHPSRSFGPFIPLETHYPSSSSPTSQTLGCGAVKENEQRPTRLGSPSTDVIPVPPIPDTNSESLLSTVAGAVRSELDLDNIGFSQPNNNDETSGDSDAMAASASQSSAVFSTRGISTRGTFTPGMPSRSGDKLLHFDWAWIAAARQVIEFNLRDLLRINRHQGVLRALLSLEGLRPYSAPGFPPSAPEPAIDPSEGEDGRTFKDGEGWDWAGVEGQWRRCVCWMDYREFVSNNEKPLAARFANPALDEVMRIVPYSLRITHYSSAPASWPGRPKIHLEGLAPSNSPAGETADNRQSHIHGTVQMAASGDVRWTIFSVREDGRGQWCTEGVQVGGRGSSMGVIGLWTTAEHDVSDPLGPFWTWKVGTE